MLWSSAVYNPTTAGWISELGGLTNLSAAGILGLVVLAVFAGLLIPRFIYMQKVKEVEVLRAANEKLVEVNTVTTQALGTVNSTMQSILTTLQSVLPPGHKYGGESDVEMAKREVEDAQGTRP